MKLRQGLCILCLLQTPKFHGIYYCLISIYKKNVIDIVECLESNPLQPERTGVSLENDSEKLFATMGDEMESLHKNQTWDLVIQPSGERLLLANGFSRRRKGYHQQKESSIKPGLLPVSLPVSHPFFARRRKGFSNSSDVIN